MKCEESFSRFVLEIIIEMSLKTGAVASLTFVTTFSTVFYDVVVTLFIDIFPLQPRCHGYERSSYRTPVHLSHSFRQNGFSKVINC